MYNYLMPQKTKMISYTALFDPIETGGFNVSFPDFPGCVTFGQTYEEAKIKAKEALQLWVEELSEQNQSLPMRSGRPIIDDVEVKASIS